MKKLLCSLFLIFSTSISAAQSALLPFERVGQSSSTSSYQAKKEIQEKLVLELGRELVIQMIGEEEYNQKKKNIDRMIQQNYGKFIPYVKADQIHANKNSSGFNQKISFEVSLASLREVLSQEGLLYEKVKDVRVLPVISYLDSYDAKSYKWWYSKDLVYGDFLWRIEEKTESILSDKFWDSGFYLLDPSSHAYSYFLDPKQKLESHRRSDLVAMGKQFDADLVVYGSVHIGASDENSRVSTVKLRWKAVLTKNERNIADVELNWNTKPGDYKEEVILGIGENLEKAVDSLNKQVVDAYQKGKFGTESMLLVLKGDLNYQDLESLKQSIRLSNYQIKSLRERRLKSGEYTFELDVSGQRDQLVKHFETWQPTDWNLMLSSANKEEIELTIQKK